MRQLKRTIELTEVLKNELTELRGKGPKLVQTAVEIALRNMLDIEDNLKAALDFMEHMDPEHFGVIVGNGNAVKEIIHEENNS